MRCRKARSLLSAACSEELDIRQQAAVREHVASCPSCKREYAVHSSLHQAAKEIPEVPISDDFNTRLLNRIAEERFTEIRTKAYLPKRAPLFQWWKSLVPVTVAAGLLAVVTLNIYQPGQQFSPGMATVATPAHMDDRYLTAQPSNNPNMTVALDHDWSLDREMAQAARIEQISQQLTGNRAFVNQLTSGNMRSTQVRQPRTIDIFQIPGGTYRIIRVVPSTGGGEGDQAY